MLPNHVIFGRAAQSVGWGWTQNRWHDEHGACCLIWAILKVMGYNEGTYLPYPVLRALDARLRLTGTYTSPKLPTGSGSRAKMKRRQRLQHAIIAWNDARGRTQQEVVAVLSTLAETYATALVINQLVTSRRAQPPLLVTSEKDLANSA